MGKAYDLISELSYYLNFYWKELLADYNNEMFPFPPFLKLNLLVLRHFRPLKELEKIVPSTPISLYSDNIYHPFLLLCLHTDRYTHTDFFESHSKMIVHI